MLDVNFIRENTDLVKKATKAKHVKTDIDQLLELDQKRRDLITKVDQLRQDRNIASQNRDIEKGKQIKQELESQEEDLKKIQNEFTQLMLEVPNIPALGVPEGGEEDYKVIKTWGEPTKLNFTPKDHLEIGEALNLIDVHRAAKVSGSRFAYLKNEAVILELALVQYAMANLMKAGFSPIIPPALIKQNITGGLGYWNGGGNGNYYLVVDFQQEQSNSQEIENPLYLVGTGEHSVVPMHSGEILEEKDLPKKYAAFSPCFRREAGTYGKDTRGILRVHQFEKVEMVVLTTPEEDEKQRGEMLNLVLGMMEQLGLPHRAIKLANGDLGFPSAETIDIETWIPSQNKYRETHSISTTTDFQARRLNIKVGDKLGSGFVLGQSKLGSRYAHILNGTAFAIGRMIIAILENFQQADGSVKIPEVLQKYTGFSEIKIKK